MWSLNPHPLKTEGAAPEEGRRRKKKQSWARRNDCADLGRSMLRPYTCVGEIGAAKAAKRDVVA
jgi:hypothetical protein